MRSIIQSFIAGFFGPALFFVPFCAVVAVQGNAHVLAVYPLYAIPFIWAVWNVFYYSIARHVVILKKLGVWGGILGVGLSLVGVNYCQTIEVYQRYLFVHIELYQVLILDGVLYALLWESVMRYLNRILID